MKTKLLLFLSLFLFVSNCFGQITFQKTIVAYTYSYAGAVQQTNDGGYIISGIASPPCNYCSYAYLIKTNNQGDTLWTKIFIGDSLLAQYFLVQQTTDRGYIVAGTIVVSDQYALYIIKTDSLGDTLWTKTYYGDEANSVQQTTDGGYIIAGNTVSFGAGNNDVYLIKTKASGDTLWTKTYGGTFNDFGADVQQTTDSGYIITGFTNSFEGGGYDVYLIKTNTKGDTLWTKTYGGTDNDYGQSVKQTADGGFIIVGNTNSFGSLQANGKLYLIKTDVNGNSNCNENITQTIVGSTATHVGSTHTIVGSGGTSSPTATIIGSTGNDSTLCLTVGINEQTINNTITIYPNPATDQLTITGNWKSKVMKLTIYNIQGKKLLSLPLGEGWGGAVNCKPFPSGIYFVTVVFDGKLSRTADEKQQWVGRFVKE